MAVRRRQAVQLAWAGAGLAFAIGILVLVNVLASGNAVRLDVTSTGRL